MRTTLRLALLTALLSTGLAACETAKGIGRDVQKAGQALQKAAS
ncbi:MAG TPA: entericidin A/B family lipoprotein [Alphaproteobacteria bacterium]|nr:entericidin A/B family lipoprotein [Alphaproteobacteria bacterium]